MKNEVLIIGAGPAGLAMAGRLTRAKIPFILLEQSDRVAYSWTQHYDRLHLHTVNKHSSLPHMEFAKGIPTFVSRDDLIQYLTYYAKHFDINPSFNQPVQSIEKSDSEWLVKTKDREYRHKHVVVATGINRVPIEPTWPGMEEFKGTIIHSREYRNPTPFKGKKVLVVGMGNTGAEVALDLCNHDIVTMLSVRGPVNIVPIKILGTPTQKTALKLAKLPIWMNDMIAITMRRLTVGNLKKFGIETPDIAPSAQLREEGKTPVIDLGTVRKIKNEKITVVPEISEFRKRHVLTVDKGRAYADAVILCTGYKSQLEDFIPAISPALDKFGNPGNPIGEGGLEGLYFLGFNNFQPGGILGAIRSDSREILECIQGNQS